MTAPKATPSVTRAAVLLNLKLLIRRNGFSPTVAELADACGIALSTCYGHLVKLMDQGLVTEERGKARTLRPVDRDAEAEGVPTP